MRDLNSTMFYKAKFKVLATNEDYHWLLVRKLRDWLIKKHNQNGDIIVPTNLKLWTKFKFGGKLFDTKRDGSFFAQSEYHQSTEMVSWACEIVEEFQADVSVATRKWTTEVGYQCDRGGWVTISYVVSYKDVPGFIGEIQPTPGISVPSVIRELLNDEKNLCFIGGDRITLSPIRLYPGDYPKFQEVLMSPNRELPIVYISPQKSDESGREVNVLLNPHAVADSVAANALVYYSYDQSFSDEMRYLETPNYTCSGGAIRIYSSNVDKQNPTDFLRHVIITAEDIKCKGEDHILEILRRSLAQELNFYDSVFRIDDCRELIEHDRRQARIDALRDKHSEEVDEFYEEMTKDMQKIAALEYNERSLTQENASLKTDLHNQKMQLLAIREKAEKADDFSRGLQWIQSLSKWPNSPLTIAEYFENVFSNRIVFTTEAKRSLEKCITRSEILWDALYQMSTCLYDLLHEDPANAYKRFTQATGWPCARGNGANTHADAKLMRQYTTYYMGKEVNIEAHIKSGNKDSDDKSIRIYFGFDQSLVDKIIIGHCGKHLDNASTQKVH